MKTRVREGNYDQFGASKTAEGICFTFEGDKESNCAVRLYDRRGKARDKYIDIPVPAEYCIGAVRSICVEHLDDRYYDYNYVINGSVVVDPYAKRIIGREKWADYARSNEQYEIRCGFDFEHPDWTGDHFPEIPRREMVMYKLHVRGFTKDGGATGRAKGTFEGIRERIPYLKELGVTTLELMPAYEFEELVPHQVEEPRMDFAGWAPQAVAGYQLMQQKEKEEQEKILPTINYWGYGPGNYFAPKASYAAGGSPSAEFRTLIRSLHEAGMECVMEMNFDQQMNPNYIVEVLRYWVSAYHIDGFHLLCSETAVAGVIFDVMLRRTKIFYTHYPETAWNQTSGYPHLYVYNDDYLYAARKMVNHLEYNMSFWMNQMKKQHPQIGFVNYFSNNNGFTLADVFAYDVKHNQENGEDGKDGSDWNYSSNCGYEGKSRKKKIMQLREGRMKQAIATVLLAQGVPLILAGDEFGNSQNGNNNAYCQDNRVGWVNWKQLERNREYHTFVKTLLAFRKSHPAICSDETYQMNDREGYGMPDLSYHGTNAWSTSIYPSLQSLGMAYGSGYAGESADLYIGWNFSDSDTTLALPKAKKNRHWQLAFGEAVVDKEQIRVKAGTVVGFVMAGQLRKKTENNREKNNDKF